MLSWEDESSDGFPYVRPPPRGDDLSEEDESTAAAAEEAAQDAAAADPEVRDNQAFIDMEGVGCQLRLLDGV